MAPAWIRRLRCLLLVNETHRVAAACYYAADVLQKNAGSSICAFILVVERLAHQIQLQLGDEPFDSLDDMTTTTSLPLQSSNILDWPPDRSH